MTPQYAERDDDDLEVWPRNRRARYITTIGLSSAASLIGEVEHNARVRSVPRAEHDCIREVILAEFDTQGMTIIGFSVWPLSSLAACSRTLTVGSVRGEQAFVLPGTRYTALPEFV